jgi:hypothetical protein
LTSKKRSIETQFHVDNSNFSWHQTTGNRRRNSFRRTDFAEFNVFSSYSGFVVSGFSVEGAFSSLRGFSSVAESTLTEAGFAST